MRRLALALAFIAAFSFQTATPAHGQVGVCYDRATFEATLLTIAPSAHVVFQISGHDAVQAAMIYSAIPPPTTTISDLSVVYGSDLYDTELWTLWFADCLVGRMEVTPAQRRQFLGAGS